LRTLATISSKFPEPRLRTSATKMKPPVIGLVSPAEIPPDELSMIRHLAGTEPVTVGSRKRGPSAGVTEGEELSVGAVGPEPDSLGVTLGEPLGSAFGGSVSPHPKGSTNRAAATTSREPALRRDMSTP